MADWFKLHENWFHEPRLQWAIKEHPQVIACWLWVLTECCRTKSDTVGLHSEDYELLGIQQLLNMSPGIFTGCLKALQKIKYVDIDEGLKTIKVLRWNDFQSDYLTKKSRTKLDKVGQCPTKCDSVRLEERRVEEKIKIEPNLLKKEKFQGQCLLSRRWCILFNVHCHSPYPVSAKDEAAAVRLMSSGIPLDQIMDVAVKAWNSHIEYISKVSKSLATFCEKFNEIRPQVGALSKAPKAFRPSFEESQKGAQ